MRRTEALVSSMRTIGRDDEIGARALLGIGQLRGRGCGRTSPAVMPGRASTRSALHLGQARRRPRPCRPGSSRLSRTARGCRARPAARRRCAARKAVALARHRRVDRAPRAGAAPPARRAPARPARCDRRRSAPVVPGNAASISATRAPSGPCSRWTTASASNTGTPSSREHPRHGRLAHADRAGEAEDDHGVSSLAQLVIVSRGGGRPRRNTRNASAAWPISIASPSTRPEARAPGTLDQQAVSSGRIDHVEDDAVATNRRQAVARSRCGIAGNPAMPSGVALIDTGAAVEGFVGARRSRRRRRSVAKASSSVPALGRVARRSCANSTTAEAGQAADARRGRAPPAPIRQMGAAPARRRRPAPSGDAGDVGVGADAATRPRRRHALTAPIRRDRSIGRAAAMTACLCGMVTLQPRQSGSARRAAR